MPNQEDENKAVEELQAKQEREAQQPQAEKKETYSELITELHRSHEQAENLLRQADKLSMGAEDELKVALAEIEGQAQELTDRRESEQIEDLIQAAVAGLEKINDTIAKYNGELSQMEEEEHAKKLREYMDEQERDRLARSLAIEHPIIEDAQNTLGQASEAVGSQTYQQSFGGRNRARALASFSTRLEKITKEIEKEERHPKKERTERLLERAQDLVAQANELAEKTLAEFSQKEGEGQERLAGLQETLVLAERLADEIRKDLERRNQSAATQSFLGGMESGAQEYISEIKAAIDSDKVSDEQIAAWREKVNKIIAQAGYGWMTRKGEPASARTSESKQESPITETESVGAPEKPVETVQKEEAEKTKDNRQEYMRLRRDTDVLNELDAALYERIKGLEDRMTDTEILTIGDPTRGAKSRELHARLKALEGQMHNDADFHPRAAEIAVLVQQAREDLNSYKIDIEKVEQRIANIKPGETAPEAAQAQEKGESEIGKESEAKPPGLFSRLRERASEFLRRSPEAEKQAETKENLDDYKKEMIVEIKAENDKALSRLLEIKRDFGADATAFSDDFENLESFYFLQAVQSQLEQNADLSGLESADGKESVKLTAEAKIAIARDIASEAEKHRFIKRDEVADALARTKKKGKGKEEMPFVPTAVIERGRISRSELSSEELQKAALAASKAAREDQGNRLLDLARGKDGKFDKELAAEAIETYLSVKYEDGVRQLEKMQMEHPENKKVGQALREAKKYRKFVSERGIKSLRSWGTFEDMDFFRAEYENDLAGILEQARQGAGEEKKTKPAKRRRDLRAGSGESGERKKAA